MKAIQVRTPGGPDALEYLDVSQPAPAPGQALVKIDAAGVNFIDVYQRSGQYRVATPFIMGQEAGGTVAAVGQLLGQVARLRGARVIGTVSTEEKAELAREAGADEVILYTQQDFEVEVKRMTDGAGLQVVYDSVGQTTFTKGLNCLAPRGIMVLYGQSSGPVGPFDPQILNQKGSLFLTRPTLHHYIAAREELVARAEEVLDWVREEKLRVRIAAELPLAQAAEAHRLLEGRRALGKVLLVP